MMVVVHSPDQNFWQPLWPTVRTAAISCLLPLALGVTLANGAFAASVDQGELAQIRAQVRSAGIVSVTVHVHEANLRQIADDASKVRTAAKARADALMAELGASALANSRWDNGMGQIGLHVTEAGLDRLIRSSKAIAFWRGPGWVERSGLDNSDGGLAAIEQLLQRDGSVDLEVIPNIDGLGFDLLADGTTSYSAEPAATQPALDRLNPIWQSLTGADVVRSRIVQRLRTTRDGLLALAYSPAVRHIRLAGFVDRRSVDVDPLVQADASAGKTVDFVLTLRNTLSGGILSTGSNNSLKLSNRRALTALLGHARPEAVVQDFSLFGAAHVRLNAGEFDILIRNQDKRLLAVTGLRVVGVPQLATSAGSMNMALPWSSNFNGANQTIIVMDTGVQASHPFFLVNGNDPLSGSRVINQFCFGTTGTVFDPISGGTLPHTSHCPGASAATAWDSPIGTPNAAAPILSSDHGTHVAGIAAGGNKTAPAPAYRGMASKSNIIAAQVFSQQGSNTLPSLVSTDLLAALQLAKDELPVLGSGLRQPYSINMSLAISLFPTACTGAASSAFMNAALLLTNAGVPLVASTGNDGSLSAIGFPACLPHVIKVSATVNDGIGNSRSIFSSSQSGNQPPVIGQAANVVNTSDFGGGTFWLAPGGGKATHSSLFTSVNSSIAAGNGYEGNFGTSMAAPHITSVYAIAKSANPVPSVPDWTVYFQAPSRSIFVPLPATDSSSAYSIRRMFFSAL